MFDIEFLITSLIVVLLPGTGVIYTVSTGLVRGKRASLFAALGCTAGIIPHLLASILGLAAVLHASSVAFQFVKILGVLYLAYLAWTMWRESSTLQFDDKSDDRQLSQIALRGFLINILNPKLSIFFLAFLPQFVPSQTASPMLYMAALSLVFMAMTFIVFVFYGLCAHGVRTYIANSPQSLRWIQRAFAGVFLALGAKLAFVER